MIFTRNCLQILKFPEFRTLVLPFYWPESFRCLRCKLSELASLRISDSRRGITTTKAQNRWPARPAAGDHRMATAFDRPRPTCLVFALLLVVEYARGTRRALPRSPAKPARYRFPRSAGRRVGRPGRGNGGTSHQRSRSWHVPRARPFALRARPFALRARSSQAPGRVPPTLQK